MKRKLLALILALLLCVGLIMPALAVVEEFATVKVDDVTGCSQADGVYTVVRDGLYGFYHVDGSELAAPMYVYAEDFQDGMAVVSPNGTRYGYVDLNGRLSIAPQYRRAFPFSEGRAFAVLSRRGNPVLVLLDQDGRELASFSDAVLQPDDQIRFSEGLAVIPTLVEIETEEEDIPDGEEASVDEETSGEEETGSPEEEEDVLEVEKSTALVYRVVDVYGEEVCVLTDVYVDYENGYHDGRIAVADAGSWVETGSGAYQRFVPEAGCWGYRDTSGELAVTCRYDEAAPFSEGIAGVGLENENGRIQYGFIDPDGGMVLPLMYDGFLSCENGSGGVLWNGKWAYIDEAGRLLTGFLFDGIGSFSGDMARIQVNRQRGIAGADGEVLFTADVRQMLPCGGVVLAQDYEGMWGVYDRDGALLVDFEYDRAFHWDGYLWLKRGGMWRVYLTEDVLADRAAKTDDMEGEPVASVGTFSDVAPDAYYAQAVTWATDSDIVAGTGGGLFSPDRPCTTGEIVVCLWRAVGKPEPQVENPFKDVSPTHYYYQAALWAYENGLVSGDVFAAAEPCTRAMVVTYLWTMDGRPYGLTDAFSDVPLDADCVQAVAWAVNHGITEGDAGGLFNPESICSRGQIVTFLYRYMVG